MLMVSSRVVWRAGFDQRFTTNAHGQLRCLLLFYYIYIPIVPIGSIIAIVSLSIDFNKTIHQQIRNVLTLSLGTILIVNCRLREG